ncbi:GNAT family N-acetyltransferase [Candidatus Bipolaricaulota bacterium]|nr:GNAT family N-acetyltransferase [Candidatus Bipolaricaulota bacterium]
MANLEQKLAWVRRGRREFGDCGRLLYAEGLAVGYAQYGPPSFFPTAGSYPAGPVSDDAVFLACLFVPSRAHRGRGWGSVLLQDVLRELRRRGVSAVETFARVGNAENPSGPVGFYLRHGFEVLRDDPEFPLLRLNLSR